METASDEHRTPAARFRMIGIDTNVLIRHVMHDDPAQSDIAGQFMRELTIVDPGFVSVAVMLETVWTLERSYGLDRSSVAKVVTMLLGSAEVVVQAPDVVRRGLAHSLEFNASFADTVVALLGIDSDCDYTVTFDKRASKLPGMRLLGAG